MQNTNFYDSIKEYLKQKNMDGLKQILNSASEDYVLSAIQDLSDKDQVIVYRLLSKDKALDVFEELDTDDQQNLLRSFTDEQAIEAVNELAPDDRVRLLDELPATVAKKLLAAISPEEREMTNLLMGYEAQTAGRIMTPEFVHLHKGITAAMALEQVKVDAVEKETIYTIYIVDGKGKLEGAISLRDLLIAKPDAAIEDIMKKIAVTVSTDTDQEEVARLLQKLDWLAVPVVDKENRLVGIVTVDDAIDILEDETTEDILASGGIFASKETNRSEVLVRGSLWAILKVRMPFLFITIVGGLLAALVLDGFEEVLEAVVVVAFFIPLIMDMGGSVGTQSSTSFVRGVVLGHINLSRFFKHLAKEIGIGFCIGIIAGTISGAIAIVWQGDIMLGLSVGIALALTVTLAATLGFFVPFVLMKLNADQAAGAAPIITTVKDISGILIYFTTVSILLAGLIATATDYEVTAVHVTRDGLHFVLCPEEETATVVGRYDNYKFDVVIPQEIAAMGEVFAVTEIGDEAFRGLGLTSVMLPYGIEVIGDNAFRSNYLASIYLPASIVEIGDNAFRDNRITHLSLYYEIEDFGDDIFRQNLLTEIAIPLWMTEVFEGTFRQNQLVSIIFHDRVEVIGEDAFMSNLLTEINLPNSLIEIEEDGFRDNLLTHVVFPYSLQIIGYRAFMDNELVSIVIPSSVMEWTFHAETGQGDHFNNNPLERIYTDLNNASALADMLTEELMGEITSATTTIFDTSGAVYQRNNLAANPIWE